MSIAPRWGETLTVEEVWEMPDDGHRRELVDGALLVTPAPGAGHQTGVLSIAIALKLTAPPELQVFIAPFDWVAGPRSLFQPDVLVARRDQVGPANLSHPPVLAVEVLSPSTRHIDLGLKRSAYEAAGVAHYWVFDPTEPSLLVLRIDGGAYEQVARVTGDDAFESIEPFAVTMVPNALLD